MNRIFIRLLLLVLLTCALVPFTSALPDGLERVAEQLAFAFPAQEDSLQDSSGDTPAEAGSTWSSVGAGIVGAALVFGGLVLVGKTCIQRL